MPRKVPSSTSAKKAKLQAKRAEKRSPDDAAPKAAPAPARRKRPPAHSTDAVENAQRKRASGIESRFLKLPKALSESLRLEYSQHALERPIDPALAYIHEADIGRPDGVLTVPRRPKWRFDASKKSVEKNEEALHAKWLGELDRTVDVDRLPTFSERNLDVWRQLWRVTEAAQILVVLLDVRFPLLHYPPSLRQHLRTLRPRKEVVLVLSKCDLVPPELAERWREWLQAREDADEHGGTTTVVCIESYLERPADAQGTRTRYAPGTSNEARRTLVDAIRATHLRLITPPATVAADPVRLAKWRPRVRPDIDWDRLLLGAGDETAATGPVEAVYESKADARKARRSQRREGIEGASARPSRAASPEPVEPASDGELDGEPEERTPDEQRFLTVATIGSPNVGKSSLLNALLGKKVVRASRTPGKTKHLQTIFWQSDVRLCDCPGLVCPSTVGMSSQVLGGIIPIQAVETVLSYVAARLPLERCIRLADGDTVDAPAPTIDETRPDRPLRARKWTTDDLLASNALAHGFFTAKAGRPDVGRAGAGILRALQSGAIRWAFRPPDGQHEDLEHGIWLGGVHSEVEQAMSDVEEDGRSQASSDGGTVSGSESSDSDEENEPVTTSMASPFAALEVDDGDESESA